MSLSKKQNSKLTSSSKLSQKRYSSSIKPVPEAFKSAKTPTINDADIKELIRKYPVHNSSDH